MRYKLVFTVPDEHAEKVRDAVANAGAGTMGNYARCSFSVRGTGRFLPLEGANPAYGNVGKETEVNEERIEFLVTEEAVDAAVQALKAAHPYEVVAYELYPLSDRA